MAKKSNSIATPKGNTQNGNRRKKCDSSNLLPVEVGDTNATNSSGEIILYQPDETISLEVRMGEESVWLTQQQMASCSVRTEPI